MLTARSRLARISSLAAGALAASALAACGGGSGDEPEEIVIGAYGPLTGPASTLKVLYDSMDAYFEEVNEQGGIDGHKVKLVLADDQLNPAQTPAAARRLVERDKATMMCGPAGSPTTLAVKDYLEARDIGIVPGAGSNELIGETSYLQVPTYSPLAAQVVEYLVEEKGYDKIAIAYTEDAVGQPTLAGATWQLEQMGLEPVATVPFNGQAPDQNALAAKLKDSGAEAVVVNNVAAVISQVFKSAEKIGYAPEWAAFWPALNENLLELSGSALEDDNIVFGSPFLLGDDPDAQEFRDVMEKHAPSVDTTDTIAMLGWTSASVCQAVIERAIEAADGGIPTAEQITAAMPGTTLDDGYVNDLEWSEDDHTGQNASRIIGVKDGAFVSLTDPQPLPDAPESD